MQQNRILRIASIAAALVLLASVAGTDENAAVQQIDRSDLLTIDGGTSSTELTRPPVQFPHDLHTEALTKQDEDCTVCHPLRENGRLSPLFMRLEEIGGKDTEELYHEQCIGCHKKKVAVSGPVACGDCHRKHPAYASSRQPFGFDKSLHYRHVAAHNEKCESCHHIYDEASKELVYVEGREEPCRDCHRTQTEDNRSSFRLAAHEDCVGCHREIAIARPEAAVGPQSCGGCHDRQRQAAIEVVEQPPRLKRGQPDFVLLSAREADLDFSKLNTVPFSHADHEHATNNCRVCHHNTLMRCNECHTLSGDDKGNGVTLQLAMHSMTSDHSCIGCHQAKTTTPECAGCHDLMEQGRLSEHACNICHAGPSPEDLDNAKVLFTSMDQFQPVPPATVLGISTSDIPDSVVIGTLAKSYSAVSMPHGKIVNALTNHINNSKLATHFHGHENVVCQGCHHHGSVGRKPALCENCHGEPFQVSDLFRPGLKGAYHRQCTGCHVSMGLQAATNCVVCHPNEQPTAGMTIRRNGEGAYHE